MSNKRRTMSENYTDCLFNDKIILESEQVFGSDYHDVYTVEIIKIALSSNDDKRLQTLDRITTWANAFKMCESQKMIVRDAFVKNYIDCPFYDQIIFQP